MDTTFAINVAVVVALMLFAISTFLLVVNAVPLLMQGKETLGAVERLAKTLDDEVAPTLAELREVMDGVNQIRSVTAARVNEVGHKVEDVAGSLTGVVGQAQKASTVWGVGLIAGFRAYLTGKNSNNGTGQESKQITMDRGEQHELKP